MGKIVDRFQAAQKDGAITVITPKYVEFKEKSTAVIGILRGISKVASSRGEGEYNQYLVETDGGMVKFAMGAATDKEIEQIIKRDYLYSFTFLGKEKLGGGRSVNKFLVEAADFDDNSSSGNPDDTPF